MFRPTPPRWRAIATPIALAIVSLIAAVVLWVAVTDAENPNKVAVFSGAIEVKAVNVPEGQAVAAIRQPNVSLRVSASEDVFKKLTTADFAAEVDLSGVHEASSDQLVVARVVGKREAEIVEVQPSFVTVQLEPSITKLVPVAATRIGSSPQGFSVPSIDANPTTVRVSGATSLVQRVATAGADVNLTGLRVTLQQQLPLTARDAQGADIHGVAIEPAVADMKVNVAQQEVTIALTVVTQVQGSVADGYNLVSIVADPPALAVSGPLEQLQALSFVTTDSIDVSGLRGDVVRTAHLRLPAGLQASRDSVTVRLKVAPAIGELTYSVVPQVTGVDEGLKATLQTAAVNVKLRGEMPTLKGIVPSSLKVTVNANGLGEGIQVLTPTVNPPEGVQVTAIDPPQVVVVIRK